MIFLPPNQARENKTIQYHSQLQALRVSFYELPESLFTFSFEALPILP